MSVNHSVFFFILSNLRNYTIEAFLYPQLLRKGMLSYLGCLGVWSTSRGVVWTPFNMKLGAESRDITKRIYMLITSGSYRVNSGTRSYLNPIQPNIRMHILHIVLYKFLKVLAGGLAINNFFSLWSYPLFSLP